MFLLRQQTLIQLTLQLDHHIFSLGHHLAPISLLKGVRTGAGRVNVALVHTVPALSFGNACRHL